MDDEAEKPSGWLDDEPALIPDPSSEKPSDWDEVSAFTDCLLAACLLSTCPLPLSEE